MNLAFEERELLGSWYGEGRFLLLEAEGDWEEIWRMAVSKISENIFILRLCF